MPGIWVVLYGAAFFASVLGVSSRSSGEIKISDTITLLSKRIQSLQVKVDSHMIIPPWFWRKHKGMYPSQVKFNVHGNPVMAFFRREFNVYDNNMFASTWITVAILEASAYGGAPKAEEEQVQMTLDSITEFFDHNRFNGSSAKSSIKTFWPQVLNATTETWKSTPSNLLGVFKMTNWIPWGPIEFIMKVLGLNKLERLLESLLFIRGSFLDAFLIPPDADVTFTNLGLGALLTDLSTEFPNARETWLSHNTNLDDVWDTLVKYAYRPFSTDIDAKCIDPRTYYYARKFLEDAKSRGEDIALATTWIQNIDETRYMAARGVHMPFNVNNVDVTVSSNVVFAITAAVITGLVDIAILDRPELMQIYINTSNFVVWQLDADFHQRPDLALPYYPSEFEAYWFAGRTLAMLEQKAKLKPLPHPVFEQIRQRFRSTLQNHVTDVITSKAKHESTDMIYYDDFLGDGDTSIFGTPKVRGEDRIFTTATAVNALISSWSVLYKGELHWDQDVPAIVTKTVQKAVTWLKRYSLDGEFKPWNAFFSGSAKGGQTMPYSYPINFLQYLNGTDIPLNTTQVHWKSILAMCGTVPESEYQVMLNQTHFGTPGTPRVFPGYNGKDIEFPFWSSEAYTYSVTLLALAQYRNLAKSSTEVDVKPDLD